MLQKYSKNYNSISIICNKVRYLHNKTRYVCLYVANGRPNGWANQDQTWHRDSC